MISLQQNLISFSSINEKDRERDLEKCKKYLYLFKMNGSMILEYLSKNEGIFTFEEYKSVVEMIYQSGSNLVNSCDDVKTASDDVKNESTKDSEFEKEGKKILLMLKEYFITHRM